MLIKFMSSACSSLDHKSLLSKIEEKLLEDNYIIVSHTSDSISFKLDSADLFLKGASFSKFNSGVFSLHKNNVKEQVKLEYAISYLSEIIIIASFALISFFAHQFAILCYTIPFIVQFIIRIINLKSVSKSILEEIIR